MPNSKNAIKAIRQDKKKKVNNLRIMRSLKASIKDSKRLIDSGSKDVQKQLQATVKIIDKAAQKGAIKKNNASRRKSRLFAALSSVSKK
jgi:ribosomal protein S20